MSESPPRFFWVSVFLAIFALAVLAVVFFKGERVHAPPAEGPHPQTKVMDEWGAQEEKKGSPIGAEQAKSQDKKTVPSPLQASDPEFSRSREELLRIYSDRQQDGDFRLKAFQDLAVQVSAAPPEGQVSVLDTFRKALEDPYRPIRAEALDFLSDHQDPLAREKVAAWLEDPAEKGLHHAAIKAAVVLGMKEKISSIRKFLEDPDEVTRRTALVVLGVWKDMESRKAFERAAKDENANVAEAAREALKNLDGADLQKP